MKHYFTNKVVRLLSLCVSLGRSRLLETVDLDLTSATALQFTIQVGSSRTGCARPTDNTEDIYLQYSINGGVTWNLMKTFAYNSGANPSQQNIVLINATKTPSTRIRWYQPKASGSNLDVWALDDVYIDSALTTLPFADTFDPIRLANVYDSIVKNLILFCLKSRAVEVLPRS